MNNSFTSNIFVESLIDSRKPDRGQKQFLRISVYYIWHEGLPEFVRPVIWPIVVGNKQQVSLPLYRALQAQYYNLI